MSFICSCFAACGSSLLARGRFFWGGEFSPTFSHSNSNVDPTHILRRRELKQMVEL